MTFRAVDVYEILEPLLKDYRKLRYRNMSLHLVSIIFLALSHPVCSWVLAYVYG